MIIIFIKRSSLFDHEINFLFILFALQVSTRFAKNLLRVFQSEQPTQFGSTASVVSAFTEVIFSFCSTPGSYAITLLCLFAWRDCLLMPCTVSNLQFSRKVHPQYQRYCLNYSKALSYLDSLKKDEDFQEFMKVIFCPLILENFFSRQKPLASLLVTVYVN